MKNFRRAIKDIYQTLNSILIFEDILTSVLVFLGLYLLFMLVNVRLYMALLFAVIYLIYATSKDLNKKLDDGKLIAVEGVYPELNEKLRTAADNVYLENPVVEELQEEVAHDLRRVRASTFFSTKRTMYKIFGAILLCFLIVVAALLNFKLIDLGLIVKKAPKFLIGGPTNATGNYTMPSAGMGSSDDIFGEESIADLGTKELDVELKSLGFELTNVRQETDLPDKEFDEAFPDKIDLLQECDADCVLENNIPIDHQELVKNYFIRLAET